MNGKNEGCFLQTLNCGCVVVFAIIAFIVIVVVLGGACPAA